MQCTWTEIEINMNLRAHAHSGTSLYICIILCSKIVFLNSFWGSHIAYWPSSINGMRFFVVVLPQLNYLDQLENPGARVMWRLHIYKLLYIIFSVVKIVDLTDFDRLTNYMQLIITHSRSTVILAGAAWHGATIKCASSELFVCAH